MLNDSNDISCTVPVFAGNEAAPFPGIRERKMTGIPGRLGNGRPGMKTLVMLCFLYFPAALQVGVRRLRWKIVSRCCMSASVAKADVSLSTDPATLGSISTSREWRGRRASLACSGEASSAMNASLKRSSGINFATSTHTLPQLGISHVFRSHLTVLISSDVCGCIGK